ncbi:MAG: alkaline phosphatase family protein [Phycisphaeraceae bacterium]|nr:alkaline phosphatase family protein [Phycisphaeraceae bacterium]
MLIGAQIVAGFAVWGMLAGAAPPTPKVLILGVDGMRADAMLRAQTPSIDRLMAEGCYTWSAQTGDVTVSGPGWSSFLCGVWRDKHGVRDNTFRGADYEAYPHFFVRLKEIAPRLTTAHLCDWLPIDQFILGDFEPDHRFAVDYEDDGDAKTVDAAIAMFTNHRPDVTFIYFADVDTAGHTHGFHPFVPEYLAEIEEVDGQIGLILDAVFSHPEAAHEDWLIILCTDHSGTLDGAHGRNEPAHREMPMIVSGARSARGMLHDTANQVDIPATALAFLGLTPLPVWNWDGRPVGLRAVTPLGENIVFNGDAEYTLGYPDAKSNAGIAGWNDIGPMTVVRYGASEGFPSAAAGARIGGGRNFFCGGSGPDRISRIEQSIGIADLTARIDAGEIWFELGAHLGGYASQRDCATVICEFIDAYGGVRGRAQVGPVMAADRARELGSKGLDLTGLVRRDVRGAVPSGTRRVRLTLVAEAGSGDNDGYADNITLVLHAR